MSAKIPERWHEMIVELARTEDQFAPLSMWLRSLIRRELQAKGKLPNDPAD